MLPQFNFKPFDHQLGERDTSVGLMFTPVGTTQPIGPGNPGSGCALIYPNGALRVTSQYGGFETRFNGADLAAAWSAAAGLLVAEEEWAELEAA